MPIDCLICRRQFRALGRHLRSAHQISGTDYRVSYDLPASYPLADDDLRDAQRTVMCTLREIGAIDNSHLPLAVESAKTTGRGVRSTADIDRQREIARKTGSANRAKPGAEKNPRGQTYSDAREKLNRWRKAK